MMIKEGSAQIVYFMTPGVRVLALGCGHTCICHIVKMHYSFKNLLPNSQAWFRQTKYIVMMKEEEYTHIVNFMTPGQGFLR